MAVSVRDRVFAGALRLTGAAASTIVLLVVLYLCLGAIPALSELGIRRFFTDSGWFPSAGARDGAFNLTAMLAGTVATTIGAVALTAPLGVLSAIFSRFYAPASLRRPYQRIVELLAGIPSVVYGFWGLVCLVPLIRELAPPGPSLLAGILILTIMILPTVALLADAALEAIPLSQLEGAAALGLTRLTTLRDVVFPAARAGLGIAVVLGTMRAIGETMAVLMVCGNVVRMPDSVFAPVRTLTANIALELGYATAEHRSVLFVSGVMLMLIVLALVAVQERLRRRAALA